MQKIDQLQMFAMEMTVFYKGATAFVEILRTTSEYALQDMMVSYNLEI